VRQTLLRRSVAVALVAAAIWFLVDAIASNWEALREHQWQVDIGLLMGSVVAHVAVLGWGVWVWGRVLRCFGRGEVGLGLLLRIWFLSNLARYIPGKIFQFVAVAQLARGAGLPAGVLLASLLIHTGFALLSAGLLSAWTLGGHLGTAVPFPLIVGAATVASAAVVHPTLLNLALSVVSRMARRDLLRWYGRWRDGVLLLLLSVVSWSFYGVAYFLFLAALTPLPISAVPQLSGINALSFVAGYLALVTPGGLGVREAAMTALLLPLLPRSVAAVLAIASRLWTIAAEIIGGMIALIVARRMKPGSGPATDEIRARAAE
jgi:glycosyltransferase 2 family protein